MANECGLRIAARSCTELLLVARRRHAEALREGARQVRLVGQAHGRGHVGRCIAGGQARFTSNRRSAISICCGVAGGRA